MSKHLHNIYLALVWGTGTFALQTFIIDPESRIRILLAIVLAYIILILNQRLMTEKYRTNRLLRYILPLLIMNTVLITAGLALSLWHNLSPTSPGSSQLVVTGAGAYVIFNIFIIVLYQLQYRIAKNKLNHQLKLKKAQLDS